MTITRRASLATGLLAIPGLARAQDAAFPSRPIRIIVPFPAGGTTDVVARLMAPGMSQRLGQTVVVENRAGAGGSIGAEVVARAAPDGHTMLMHNTTFPTTTAAMQLAGRAPHDILADFAPVSLSVTVPLVLLATPSVQVADLRGFIAAAKAAAQAGTPFFYGSTGPGSIYNLVGEVLRREAGLNMEHIPFRGAAPLVQELMAGRVQMGGDQLSTSLEHIRAGTLRPLASLSAQRSAAVPTMPTMREQGLPSLELEGWNGLFAPARTPPAIVARLQQAASAAVLAPEVALRMVTIGAEPVGSDVAVFTAMVTAQYGKIRALVVEVGLRPE